MENLETSMMSRMEERIESLEKSLENMMVSQGGDTTQPRYPECPIYLENMTHGTRIMQCGLGHLLCQKNFDRLDYSSCPVAARPSQEDVTEWRIT